MSLIEAMAQNERFIGKLYLKYSDKFQECRELWDRLAQEEEIHAGWLLGIQDNLDQSSANAGGKRFNKSTINTFCDYLKSEMEKLDAEEVLLINALSVSLYIEQSLIEHKYFEVLGSDSEELKNTFSRLKSETENHLKQIKEVWLKHK